MSVQRARTLLPTVWRACTAHAQHCVHASALVTDTTAPQGGAHLQHRFFTPDSPLRVVVVGAGPAGCYTVDRLLHRYKDAVRVDLLERLPTPFGLVRFGVAPDHGATSRPVVERFTRLFNDPRVTLLCGAPVGGGGVPVSQLGSLYHAVVLAVGAPGHKPLHIPGESSLRNVCSARDFVAWYNGHPEHSHSPPVDLKSGAHAVIIGFGNVALDCARLLLRQAAGLAATDMPSPVVGAFVTSTIRHVTLVARRSAAYVAATPKELREVLHLPGVTCSVHNAELDADDQNALEAGPRQHRRALEALLAAASHPPDAGAHGGDARTLRVVFLRSPVECLPRAEDKQSVGAVRLRANKMSGPPDRRVARPVQPGAGGVEDDVLAADVLLSSVGYAGLPFDSDVPFDAKSATIPHAGGAVVHPDTGEPISGLFTVGWAKRGATGIIGTNLTCAEETVATLLAHADAGRLPEPSIRDCAPADRVAQILHALGVKVLTRDAWTKLDEAERARGQAAGKPREKMTSLSDMLAYAETCIKG